MPLVTLNDVNTHLPTEDGRFELDESGLTLLDIDATRTIKGYLLGKYSAAELAAWDTPANTPELIRSIAGRLVASKAYATRLGEEGEDSKFAQNLYNEAMKFLDGLRSGGMSLAENPDEGVSTIVGFPDDTVEPFFTMDQVL